MKTSDILNKAAEVMMERGHCKTQLIGHDGSVCVMGAINEAQSRAGVWTIIVGTPEWAYLEEVLNVEPVEWNFTATLDMALGALHEAAILAKEQGD